MEMVDSASPRPCSGACGSKGVAVDPVLSWKERGGGTTFRRGLGPGLWFDRELNVDGQGCHPDIGGDMKSFTRTLTALAAAVSIVFSGAAVAAAAPVAPTQAINVVAAKKAPAITINKIANKTVKGSAKATIKPSVKAARGVKVTSKVLTVKQGKKTVAKNKTSVSLKAGTYKVTTKVNYKIGKKKLSASKTQTLVVKKAKVKKAWAAAKGKNCPAGYPVKGNQTGSNKEWKYHVPGGQFYRITVPEQCFKTTSDARKAGYRASKR